MIQLGRVDTVTEAEEDDDTQEVGDEEYDLDALYDLASALMAVSEEAKKSGLADN